MKQLNFSNVIAIVAILLCFYAFSNDKKVLPQQSEKEFCFMRIEPYTIRTCYSDGKYEEEDMKAFIKENNDSYYLKISCKKLAEKANDGWEFAGINKDASVYATTYIFERSK